MKLDKYRPIFDRETRTATLMSFTKLKCFHIFLLGVAMWVSSSITDLCMLLVVNYMTNFDVWPNCGNGTLQKPAL